MSRENVSSARRFSASPPRPEKLRRQPQPSAMPATAVPRHRLGQFEILPPKTETAPQGVAAPPPVTRGAAVSGAVIQMQRFPWKKALKYTSLGVLGAVGGALAAPAAVGAAGGMAIGGALGLAGAALHDYVAGGPPPAATAPAPAVAVPDHDSDPSDDEEDVDHAEASDVESGLHGADDSDSHTESEDDDDAGGGTPRGVADRLTAVQPPSFLELQAMREKADRDFRRRSRRAQQRHTALSDSDESDDSDDEVTAESMAAASARMSRTHGGGKPHGKAASRPKARQEKYERRNAARAAAYAAEHKEHRKRKGKKGKKKGD